MCGIVGMFGSEACARVIAEPTRFYNAECRTIFGGLTDA